MSDNLPNTQQAKPQLFKFWLDQKTSRQAVEKKFWYRNNR